MPSSSIHVSSKLPDVGTTIFTIMSKLAVDHGAVNLSQGFPDFECSQKLIERVENYMKKGMNQYAPMPGVISLREAISKKTELLYGYKYDPDTEITVTAGATQAIFTAISAFVKENDEVIIFEPAYDCYQPAIQLNGGKTLYSRLQMPDYSINWDEVKKLISQRTRMIIINSPHNPTGAVLKKEDMITLQKLVEGTSIIILSDEVYEHIIFEGEHQSVVRFSKLAERSLIISSFGKTYHTTGWKVGYCLAPALLMAEFRKVHQFNVFSVNTPVQYAIADHLHDEAEYIGLADFYRQKRDMFSSMLKGSRFTLLPCSGTYFQLLGYEHISDEKDTEMAKKMTIENKIASIPISVFYHSSVDNKVLRFCFAKNEQTLEKAAKILHAV